MEAAGGDTGPCIASWRASMASSLAAFRWGWREEVGQGDALLLCGALWGPHTLTPLPSQAAFLSVGAAGALVVVVGVHRSK